MSEPKPVYTITPDIDMGHTCPPCGVGITIGKLVYNRNLLVRNRIESKLTTTMQ